MSNSINLKPAGIEAMEELARKRASLPKSTQQQIEALEAQRWELNKQIYKLDPTLVPGGKTSVKRDTAMIALKEMIKQGKEPKRVGWMNSAKSADHEIYVIDVTRSNPKYRGWSIEEQDLDGDNTTDVIIKDQIGKICGINGYSVERTSFPERKPYYDTNHRPDQRRRVINGQINENAKTKKQFREETGLGGIKRIVIGKDERGNDEYGFFYNDPNAKRNPTPYKVFLHLILKPYWERIKAPIKQQVRPHEVMSFYRILKMKMWQLIKNSAHERLNTPDGMMSEELKQYESSSHYKNALGGVVTDAEGTERNEPEFNNNMFEPLVHETAQEIVQHFREPFNE